MKILNHPLVNDRLSKLRQTDCSSGLFRDHTNKIASFLLASATENLPTHPVEIQTPLETTEAQQLASPIVLVPILRAGLALLEGFHQHLPEASVAHLGMARNEETLEPETYYKNFPADLPQAEVFVLDPMLATGGSAISAIDLLKKEGAKNIHFVCLVASPEGAEALETAHPDVPITTAALDRQLNEKGYILPGLGDAGDRTFGTL